VIRASQSLLYQIEPDGNAVLWDGETQRVCA
jgi:hypothetical protein